MKQIRKFSKLLIGIVMLISITLNYTWVMLMLSIESDSAIQKLVQTGDHRLFISYKPLEQTLEITVVDAPLLEYIIA